MYGEAVDAKIREHMKANDCGYVEAFGKVVYAEDCDATVRRIRRACRVRPIYSVDFCRGSIDWTP